MFSFLSKALYWLTLACGLTSLSGQMTRPSSDCILDDIALSSTYSLYDSNFQISSLYSPTQVEPYYSNITTALGFTVQYYTNYKIVHNPTSSGSGESYVLYQCGTPRPSLSAPGVRDINNPKFFAIPLYKVAVHDTTAIAFLSSLKVLDRVQFVTKYTSHACMMKLSQDQSCDAEVKDFGPWSSTPIEGAEQLEKVDAAFYFGSHASEKSINFFAPYEPGALQRAEWIKVSSLFFNKELEAEAFYRNVYNNYVALKRPESPKTLLWVGTYGGFVDPSWGGSKNKIMFTFAAYKADYAKDAGFKFLDFNTIGSGLLQAGCTATSSIYNKEISCSDLTNNAALQAVVDVIRMADVIVDQASWRNVKRPSDIYLEDFLGSIGVNGIAIGDLKSPSTIVLRTDGIINRDTVLADWDWYEGMVPRPDLALKSLIEITSEVVMKRNMWWRKLVGVGSTHEFDIRSVSDCSLSQCYTNLEGICPSVYKNCNNTLSYATLENRCEGACTSTQAIPHTEVNKNELLIIILTSTLLGSLVAGLLAYGIKIWYTRKSVATTVHDKEVGKI